MKKKAKKLWLSRDDDDSIYEFWVKEPFCHKEVFYGSKTSDGAPLDAFCPNDFEKACPHIRLKGGEKAPITITMGKIIKAGKAGK